MFISKKNIHTKWNYKFSAQEFCERFDEVCGYGMSKQIDGPGGFFEFLLTVRLKFNHCQPTQKVHQILAFSPSGANYEGLSW